MRLRLMSLGVWVNNKRRRSQCFTRRFGSTLGLGGGVVEISHFRQANLLEQIPALLEKNFVREIGATFHS